MDIRNWPLDKILQLPDFCFGRRWPVISSQQIVADSVSQWLVHTPLPERGVVWQFSWDGYLQGRIDSWFKLALGDHEPANGAEFDAFEQFFPGDLDYNLEHGAIALGFYEGHTIDLRMPFHSQGRRFAIQAANTHPTIVDNVSWFFVISSLPREVPDWLISGRV